MKNKKHLNSLIQRLVKEAVANKIGEGQPVGGVKNDHPFDAGRHNVMKAVNIGENEDTCDCGSGQHAEWEYDAQDIPLVKACPKCRQKKLARYRPEILRGYTQADVDEPIEPDLEEKIGFDGKYVNDMESGTAVKRLHGLNETDEDDIYKEAQKIAISSFGKNNVQSVRPMNPIEPNVYGFQVTLAGKNKRNPNEPGEKTFIRYSSITNRWEKWDGSSRTYKPFLKEATNPQGDKPWREIDNGFFLISDRFARQLAGGKLPKAGYERLIKAPEGFHTKKGFVWLAQTALHSKAVWSIRDSGSWVLENGQAILSSLNLEEETGTGAVAGYATPFAFKKKKTKKTNEMLGHTALGLGVAGTAAGIMVYKTLKDVIKRAMKSAHNYKVWSGPLSEERINLMMDVVSKYNPQLKADDVEYIRQASMTAFKNGTVKTTGQLLDYLKDVVQKVPGEIKEMTGTGAVAGYQTPFAFSKKKEGSSRAIAAAKKYGTVVKSISEKETE